MTWLQAQLSITRDYDGPQWQDVWLDERFRIRQHLLTGELKVFDNINGPSVQALWDEMGPDQQGWMPLTLRLARAFLVEAALEETA